MLFEQGINSSLPYRERTFTLFLAQGSSLHCRAPVEITSGELFRIEVGGKLQVIRLEFRHFNDDALRHRQSRGQAGEYYCVDNYELRAGLRAAIGDEG